ncbi:PepSY-like domain-containing protein [Bacteroides sp. 51]|uniref:PepSY-like domain-containing protein n=1 Tax=Bacteroides sp. 51 TaxID=2302938 RepID=UPI0013D69D07|nr:PepSY-like domain-containing protein [Bacteroides sp. 51]NDV83169.1 hypothetical protein [Bacteroides sp. 51]
MKTKLNQILLLLLCAILSTIFYSCHDDDKHQFGVDDLPEAVQGFVMQYFPENTIDNAKISTEYQGYVGKQYDLTLSGGISIHYGTRGDYRITAPSGMPETANKLLNSKTLIKLLDRNPQVKVTLIRTLNEHGLEKMVKTTDQKSYRITTGSDDRSLLAELLTRDEFPSQAIAFLERYNLQDEIYEHSLMRASENGHTYYRFYNYASYNIIFDEGGKWIQAKSSAVSNSILHDVIKNEMPEKVVEALNADPKGKAFPLNISCYESGICGFIYSTYSALISANGEILNSDKEAEALMKLYYPSETWTLRELTPEISSPFECYYLYTYRNNNKIVRLYIDTTTRQWAAIRSINNANLPNVEIPTAFIENELPAKIVAYLKENGHSKVYYIKRHQKGYNIRVENADLLTFDTEGNLVA